VRVGLEGAPDFGAAAAVLIVGGEAPMNHLRKAGSRTSPNMSWPGRNPMAGRWLIASAALA